MTCCEVCDNDYDKAFEVHLAGRSHVFDSFECAIHILQGNMARVRSKVWLILLRPFTAPLSSLAFYSC
jgi:hypothetical protein